MYKKHNKERALSEGCKLFWAKGYNDVGVDEICMKTGMTKGAFYNAFNSKENFLLKALAKYGDTSVEHIGAELSPQQDERAVHRLDRFYTGMLKDQEGFNYVGCLINNTMSELAVINPPK